MILNGYGQPRKIREEGSDAVDMVVYTDGWFPEKGDWSTCERPKTGFVVFDKRAKRPVYGMATLTDREMEFWLPRKNQIMLVEMFAVIQMVASCGHRMRKKHILVFVDSMSAEGALVSGRGRVDDIGQLSSVFWRLVQEYQILVYICRVPTDGNISDGCSRGSRDLAHRLGWKEIQVVECLEWAMGWIGPG